MAELQHYFPAPPSQLLYTKPPATQNYRPDCAVIFCSEQVPSLTHFENTDILSMSQSHLHFFL